MQSKVSAFFVQIRFAGDARMIARDCHSAAFLRIASSRINPDAIIITTFYCARIYIQTAGSSNSQICCVNRSSTTIRSNRIVYYAVFSDQTQYQLVRREVVQARIFQSKNLCFRVIGNRAVFKDVLVIAARHP